MINSINGFNVNLTQSTQNLKQENPTRLSANQNEISNMQTVQIDSQTIKFDELSLIARQLKGLEDNEVVIFDGVFSLSGKTFEGKVSTWGRLMGYDSSMSKKEIDELKDFVNQTKTLGFGRLYDDIIGKQSTDVDIFAKKHITSNDKFSLGLGFSSEEEGFCILDKAQSIDEFKDAWLDYSIRKYLGEREGVENITISKDNITILANKNKPPVGFKTISAINFEDNESRAKFMELIKAGMNDGVEFKDVIKNVISLYNTTDIQKLDENSTFTSINVQSTNSKTYDINKDTKFAYQRELLKREQERGVKVLELIRKLEKYNNGVDIKA